MPSAGRDGQIAPVGQPAGADMVYARSRDGDRENRAFRRGFLRWPRSVTNRRSLCDHQPERYGHETCRSSRTSGRPSQSCRHSSWDIPRRLPGDHRSDQKGSDRRESGFVRSHPTQSRWDCPGQVRRGALDPRTEELQRVEIFGLRSRTGTCGMYRDTRGPRAPSDAGLICTASVARLHVRTERRVESRPREVRPHRAQQAIQSARTRDVS